MVILYLKSTVFPNFFRCNVEFAEKSLSKFDTQIISRGEGGGGGPDKRGEGAAVGTLGQIKQVGRSKKAVRGIEILIKLKEKGYL